MAEDQEPFAALGKASRVCPLKRNFRESSLLKASLNLAKYSRRTRATTGCANISDDRAPAPEPHGNCASVTRRHAGLLRFGGGHSSQKQGF